jgi:Ni/Fe-hydrogenase subunit HybB-like protein
MLEKAFSGSRNYWIWVISLLILVGIGTLFFLTQFEEGLGVTGMNRDVTWGFYIAQFTFLVGVAASAVMVVLPYYLHNYKEFSKITILGEFVAIGAVIMCMTFIFVDMGQPLRVVNVFFYPTVHSPMFWDSVSLMGYLALNAVISYMTLGAEKAGVKPPKWLKFFIILSIPWAFSIHTVTAFLYSGLAARPFWMSAILAPRFLATAFAAGPALLIVLCLVLRKVSNFNVGKEPIQKLALIATYAMLMNIFFVLLELFTALYSGIPHHALHFKFLYLGLDGNTTLVPWMWTSSIMAIISIILLLKPAWRKNEKILLWACLFVFLSIWIDKGLGMVVAGFTPSALGYVVDYWPTFTEFMISLGIFALGILIITVLYKVALTVRRQIKIKKGIDREEANYQLEKS